MSIKTARARQYGVTLVEMIMFMVIISIALAGILQIMRFTTANGADPLRRKQALMIAEALLEEVRQAGFTYCDPSSDNADTAASTSECTVKENWGNEVAGALRPYDNVNDYVVAPNTPNAAFNGGGAALLDALARPMNVAGYGATVTIVPDQLGDIVAGSGADDSNALRIRVVVNYGSAESVTLDGYRARYAPIARSE